MPRSIVIVPPPRLGGIYEDNRIWARQYVDANSRDRDLIALAASTAQAVVDATRAATTQAGRDGEIIYAVGHGGSGDGDQAGQADFAPRRAFRVTQFLAYYNDQTQTWRGVSIPRIERELREIRGLGSARVRRREEQAWCGRYVAEYCDVAMEQALDIERLQPHYLELGRIFRSTPVRRIVLLTCNVGNALDFLDELATDLGVPVVGYTERVVSRTERELGQRPHVWMYLEGDRRGQGSNNDRADRELLPDVDPGKVRHGRVIVRPPRRVTRRPRLPDLPRP